MGFLVRAVSGLRGVFGAAFVEGQGLRSCQVMTRAPDIQSALKAGIASRWTGGSMR